MAVPVADKFAIVAELQKDCVAAAVGAAVVLIVTVTAVRFVLSQEFSVCDT